MNATCRTLRYAVIAIALCGAVSKPVQGAMFTTQDIVNNASKTYALNFPQVAAVWVQVDGVWNERPGSGVLTTEDNTLLTAAHVLRGNNGLGGGITEIRVYFGSNIYSSTVGAYGMDFELHPGFVLNGQGFGNNDLAVLKLDRHITDITPAELYTGTLITGMELSMAGFGLPGINSTGYQAFDGFERAGTNRISGFGGSGAYGVWDSNFVFSDLSGPFSSPTALEWHGSPSDSGGGWFTSDGSLAAISTFVTGPQTPGNFLGASTGATRLDNYHPWINDRIAVMAVPEPSSFLLAGSAALMTGLYCWRKKKQSITVAA